ncbi:uncharacterized protein BKA78DRAFT_321243 [Phyllosticta capitalensis]|uniref:uncharacterized protein n=1 Tax=Phyllosticta capitalensis TaxID=121624 RepID=UPI00312D2DE0
MFVLYQSKFGLAIATTFANLLTSRALLDFECAEVTLKRWPISSKALLVLSMAVDHSFQLPLLAALGAPRETIFHASQLKDFCGVSRKTTCLVFPKM